MFSLILERNRTSPRVFSRRVRHIRVGDKVQRIEEQFSLIDGKLRCTVSRLLPLSNGIDPFTRRNGKKDEEGNPHTIKRDWLILHQTREFMRESAND